MSRVRHRNTFRLVAAVLLVAAFAPATTDPSDGRAAGSDPQSLTASTVRNCDLTEVRTALGGESRDSRVMIGLAARVCEEYELALELLSMPPDRTHRWEDWRLLALVESAAHLEQLEPGSQAVATFLEEHQGSPLYPLIYPLGVAIARGGGHAERALSLVRASRAYPLPAGMRSDLDVQAWEIAQELDRVFDLRESARQLLLHSPAEAAELEVEHALRGSDGAVPWTDLFTLQELEIRSVSLIDNDMAEEAIGALAIVPEASRDVVWHLLHGQALVDLRRGAEAVVSLQDVEALDVDNRQALDWLRAEAALDAATARRGRRNLSASEREQMRRLAHEHLWQIVRLDGASSRAADALRLLFEELADGEHFEQVRSILQRLRQLDPSDTTGTQYLWQLGWAEYRKRNLSGAIGYWSELVDIYPQTKMARRGRYWSARSHDALGNSPRSDTLYELLAAAPSADYYAKLARQRLGLDPRPDVRLSGDASVSWPRDPILDRAETLSEVGLDDLALVELDHLSDITGERTEQALRSRILARQGKRRASIQQLWQAFPVLGSAFQDTVPPDALLMYYPLDYIEIVKRFARDNKLEVPLLLAMIRQESAFDIHARSWAGARGLMQVMPATGRELATELGLEFSTSRLNDPVFSVQLGSRYFRKVLDMFDGRLELALAGYNAGPYRIKRLVREAGPDIEIDSFLEDLRFEESKTYVRRITLFSDSYVRLYPDLG